MNSLVSFCLMCILLVSAQDSHYTANEHRGQHQEAHASWAAQGQRRPVSGVEGGHSSSSSSTQRRQFVSRDGRPYYQYSSHVSTSGDRERVKESQTYEYPFGRSQTNTAYLSGRRVYSDGSNNVRNYPQHQQHRSRRYYSRDGSSASSGHRTEADHRTGYGSSYSRSYNHPSENHGDGDVSRSRPAETGGQSLGRSSDSRVYNSYHISEVNSTSHSRESAGSAPRTGYSRESAGSAQRTGYSRESAGTAPRTGYSRESAGTAPRTGYSHESAGSAPRTGYSRESAGSATRTGYSHESAGSATRTGYSRESAGYAPRTGYSRESAGSATRTGYSHESAGSATRTGYNRRGFGLNVSDRSGYDTGPGQRSSFDTVEGQRSRQGTGTHRGERSHKYGRPASYSSPSSLRQNNYFRQRSISQTGDGDECPETRMELRIDGLPCDQAVNRFGPALCYTHELASRRCCQACRPRRNQNKPGCEYGDRTQGCSSIRPADCYNAENRRICCSTCERLKRSDTPGCEYGDLSNRCDAIRAKPGLCYHPENHRVCCESCEHRQNPERPDCLWGDRNPHLCRPFENNSSTVRINCYSPRTRSICCNSCQRLKEWVPEDLPAGCEYGDQPVKFLTRQMGELTCSTYFDYLPVQHCALPDSDVSKFCCYTCHRRLAHARG